MAVTVKLPTILRKHAGGEAKVGADGATLRERARPTSRAHYPGITKNVIAEDGGLHRFINVYVNDEDVRYLGLARDRGHRRRHGVASCPPSPAAAELGLGDRQAWPDRRRGRRPTSRPPCGSA